MTPLELFFDLVFVLAITQCTGLMSHDQSWSGLARLGPALISLAVAVVLVWAMIAFEHRGYGPGREQLRREASAA